jgi:hypothetical protein
MREPGANDELLSLIIVSTRALAHPASLRTDYRALSPPPEAQQFCLDWRKEKHFFGAEVLTAFSLRSFIASLTSVWLRQGSLEDWDDNM